MNFNQKSNLLKILKNRISFYFKNKDGLLKQVKAKEGQTILEVAHENEIEIEGACDAQLACSTCHVILDPNLFNQLEEASIREEDLLDLAYDLTPTSRLGCQVLITKDFEGKIIKLPKFT